MKVIYGFQDFFLSFAAADGAQPGISNHFNLNVKKERSELKWGKKQGKKVHLSRALYSRVISSLCRRGLSSK